MIVGYEQRSGQSDVDLSRACSRHRGLQGATSVVESDGSRVQRRRGALEGRTRGGSNEAIGRRHAW